MESLINQAADSDKFILDGVAFYGRTFSEYTVMFNFAQEEWSGKRVLDCNSGPASFTAEAHEMGIHAIACDPMFERSADELVPVGEQDIIRCLSKSDAQRDKFDQQTCDRNTHYAAEKQRALYTFSRDYLNGKSEGRYVAGALPQLPFEDGSFDLVLSAHLLFVYATKDNGGLFEDEVFPLNFHIDAIRELIRIASEEVRIYPLKGPNRPDNPMLEKVLEALSDDDIRIDFETVGYKDIVGADRMLRIRK